MKDEDVIGFGILALAIGLLVGTLFGANLMTEKQKIQHVPVARSAMRQPDSPEEIPEAGLPIPDEPRPD